MPGRKKQLVKRIIGRYIVADPSICHGQPTFRGTRILVADILEQVAAGIAWETIIEEWRGNVSSDAISEAVKLASHGATHNPDEGSAAGQRCADTVTHSFVATHALSTGGGAGVFVRLGKN